MERGLVIIFRTVVGLVFLWASYNKLFDPGSFAQALDNYRLLPGWAVNPMAVVMPWLEFVCALLLLSGQRVRTASFIVSGLLVVFIAAVGISMLRGLDVQCGCFSAGSSRKIGFRLLGEDVLYLAMTGFLFFRAGDSLGWKAFLGSRREP
jgi:putative oxidoreductase